MSDRFVVLGLAPARTDWFTEVQRWSSTATVPIDFTRCISLDELTIRLGSGSPVSAVLVDTTVPGVDRDLLDRIVQAGALPLAVGDEVRWAGADDGSWTRLERTFDRARLLDALDREARFTRRAAASVDASPPPTSGPWRGHLVAVTGTPGSGTTVAAAALTQALAGDPRDHDMVALADFALRADQGVLHGARDLMPALTEALEVHAHRTPSGPELRELVHHVASGRYGLLLGLRRSRDWTALAPRTLNALIEGLRGVFRTLIVDCDAELDGAAETGSIDLEERNLLARTALSSADLVFVTGAPGVLGVHGLARTITDLVDHGIDPTRIQPVVNRMRSGRPRHRADVTRALADLVDTEVPVASAMFLPERRTLDDDVLEGAPLPRQIGGPLATLVRARLADRPAAPAPVAEPVPVSVGSIGHLAGEEGR